jgi:hypothetical protein
MVDGEFVSWVEPIARRDREARRALLDFATSAPPADLEKASPVEGWICRDVLAHLAGDTGKWFSHILTAVLDGRQPDPARVGPEADVDALNAADVALRSGRPITELVAELEADGAEHDALLARLAQDHESFHVDAFRMSLGEFFRENPAGSRGAHDREHLAQLRASFTLDG